MHPESQRECYEFVARQTAELVNRLWPEINHVASRLSEEKELSEEEFIDAVSLLDPAQIVDEALPKRL